MIKSFFLIFSAIAVLNSGVEQKELSFNDVNAMVGTYLFADANLWDDSLASFQKRLGAKFETTKLGDKFLSSIFLRGKLFGVDVEQMKIISDENSIEKIDIIFFNKGDSLYKKKWDAASLQKMRNDAKTIADNLTAKLGEPSNERFGENKNRARVKAWKYKNHAFLLEVKEKEFIIIHIIAYDKISDPEKSESTAEQSQQAVKKALLANIKKEANGDVYLDVPMVNQGSKGYCLPATIERCMLYYGVEGLDMHKLAVICNTGVGGASTIEGSLENLKKSCGAYGLKFETCSMDFSNIVKRIDKGIPVCWTLFHTNEFGELKIDSLKNRKKTDFDEWLKLCRKKPKFKLKLDEQCGHICLIIGYNKASKEIAISDSWGEGLSIIWVRFADAKSVAIPLGLISVRPKNISN